MAQTGPFIVKLSGLPWSTTTKEVSTFLKDCTILYEDEGIHITINKDGRPSGECFVELASLADVQKAKSHSNENMGKRYIIITDAKEAELAWFRNSMPVLGGMGAMGGNESYDGYDGFVKLRGLPYESTKAEIAEFFTGIDIAPYGITITMDQDGSPSGEAYVQFTSPSEVEKALAKNKEKIRHRYIELFKSSKYDVKYVTQSNVFGGGFSQPMGFRPGPYDRPSGMEFSGRGGGRGGGGMNMGMNMRGGSFGSRGSRGTGGPIRGGPKKEQYGKIANMNKNSKTGHMILMQGIPFESSQGDIYKFFAPLVPFEVRLLSEESGNKKKLKGQAEVDFETHSDAVAAMAKDKQNMGHRYIEIFLKSEPDAYDGGWSNNNSSQMNNPNGYYW